MVGHIVQANITSSNRGLHTIGPRIIATVSDSAILPKSRPSMVSISSIHWAVLGPSKHRHAIHHMHTQNKGKTCRSSHYHWQAFAAPALRSQSSPEGVSMHVTGFATARASLGFV